VVNFFPPKPVYPKNYDNDNTLFLVYNTSETITTQNNQPWSEEISIVPVDDTKPEIWADNGFASIDGELFYYDDVEKTESTGGGLLLGGIKVDQLGGITSIPIIDGGTEYYYPSVKVVGDGYGAKIEAVVENGSITNFNIIHPGKGYKAKTTSLEFQGKVFKFKRCSRNLGGNHTKFNSAGSEVRGFVIAEHHNQIADAIISIEKFIGKNFDEDKNTLDWRIRHLQSLPVIFDDYTCPDVSFNFYTVSEDPALGITIQYDVVITGSFNSYSLDFGDGQSTSTSFSGTHIYATSSTIDPIVTVKTDSCTIVQTPVSRILISEPVVPPTTPGFSINIPQIPEFPPFVFPSIPIPSTPQIPPIVFPCLDIGPIGPISISIPSIISIIPSITIPSVISIIPSLTIPSTIEILPSIPSLISVVVPSIVIPSIPTLISVTVPSYIPTLISVTVPSIPLIPSLISITVPSIPTLINVETPSCIPSLISVVIPDGGWWVSWVDPTQYEWWYNSWWVSWVDPTQYTWWVSWADPPNGYNWWISWTEPARDYNWWISWTEPARDYNWWVSWTEPANDYSWWVSWTEPANNYTWWVSWTDPREEPWYNESWWVSWTDPTKESWYGESWWVSWTDPRTYDWYQQGLWVSWSSPPPVSCIVTVQCPTASPFASNRSNNIDAEGLNPDGLFELSVGDVGIPSEIKVVFPDEIPDIKILHDLPAIIRVASPNIPSEIKITTDKELISEIRIVSEGFPTLIEVSAKNIPSSIELDARNLPKSIPIDVPENFPSIKLDASSLPDKIQVVGVPSTIELVGAPSEIKLVLPEKPEIELVYKGAPIDVKINLDVGRLTGENDKSQCVAIVPCGNQ